MAVDLRDKIHSDFSTGSGVWSDYRRQITGAYIDDKGAGVNYGDYTNHLIREYNDKITDLNQPSELYIEPFDAGFRYKINPVTAIYNSGIAAAFSAKTIGLGTGPLLRARRSTDNTEIDVRGDKNGVLSLGSPIIDYRENFLPYSEDLSEWSADGITATEIAGPNALNNDGFYRVTASAGSKTITETSPTNAPAIAAGDIFTASVYVKNVSVAGGVVKLQLTRNAGGDYEQAEVTLNNTTDEWQRFTVTHTFAQAHTSLRVRLLTSSELSSMSADVFGFQLNKGGDAEAYIKTNGSTITQLDRPQETLGEYIGTGHAYVTTWYDQAHTGSAQNNLTQTTAADQPILVNGGTLVTDSSGNSSLDFNGTSHHMILDTGFAHSLNVSGLAAYTVFDPDDVAGSQIVSALASYSNTLNRFYNPWINNSLFNYSYAAANPFASGASNTNLNLSSLVADATQGDARGFLNGSQVGSATAVVDKAGQRTDSTVGVGAVADSAHFDGKIGEFLFYTGEGVSTNREAIEANINKRFGIF